MAVSNLQETKQRPEYVGRLVVMSLSQSSTAVMVGLAAKPAADRLMKI